MSESALRLILRRAVGSTHPVHPHTNAFSNSPESFGDPPDGRVRSKTSLTSLRGSEKFLGGAREVRVVTCTHVASGLESSVDGADHCGAFPVRLATGVALC